jgi:hypothetical protein
MHGFGMASNGWLMCFEIENGKLKIEKDVQGRDAGQVFWNCVLRFREGDPSSSSAPRTRPHTPGASATQDDRTSPSADR